MNNPRYLSTCIIPNLHVGSSKDAYVNKDRGDFTCVIDVRGLIEPDENGEVQAILLDALAVIINKRLKNGDNVLVHCSAGIERSPLVIAWYLVRYKKEPTIKDAYKLIQDLRPMVQRRDNWVLWDQRERRNML